jgi:P-type E1-E2 ATPase
VSAPPPGLTLTIPGAPVLRLQHLLLDFNGTIALDGRLIDGVAARLQQLGRVLDVEVLTGDTYGTVAQALHGLGLRHTVVRHGDDKTARARALRPAGVAALGNGRNDVDMLRAATLGVAVLGPECSHALVLAAAQLVAPDIVAALDLFVQPQRLVAVLRP